MKVIIVAIVSIAVLLGNVYASEETCNAGESKFDGCNTCTCSNTGVWACTEKLCYRQRREEETCNAGESKFDGCNTCTCSNTGVWGCTQKLCYRQKREEGRCTNPGESKFDGCNTCTCTKTGIWACTRKLCFRRKRDEDRCKNPGETKSDGCNTCTCTNTGVWACTKKLCLRQRRDGISLGALEPISRTRRDMHVAEDLNTTSCAPHDYFKIDCNTCYCKTDGSGYLCTENMCRGSSDEDLPTTIVPMKDNATLVITGTGATLVQPESTSSNSSDVDNNLKVGLVDSNSTSKSGQDLQEEQFVSGFETDRPVTDAVNKSVIDDAQFEQKVIEAVDDIDKRTTTVI